LAQSRIREPLVPGMVAGNPIPISIVPPYLGVVLRAYRRTHIIL
jgi:hypothetical protein